MIINRSLWLLPLCVLLFAGDILAQDRKEATSTTVLDLPSLLDEVRENNPDLRASRLEADALALRRSQVASLPDPSVGITYQPYPLFTARGSQRSQWRVEQAVPFPGKLGLRGDIADFGAEIASYEALTFEEDLLFETKKAYYELYRIQQQQILILAFQERLGDFEANAATQYVVGTGMQQAILKAQLERNALSQRLIALNLQKRSTTETLARLLNREVSEVAVEELKAPLIPTTEEKELLALALQQRPEAKALNAAHKRTEAQIALAGKEFFPDFGFNITYFDVGTASIPATATGRDALAIGVSVKIPFWRGRLRAQLAEARTRKEQVGARIEGLDATFKTQINDLISQLTQESEQLTLFREALIPQAETTLQATVSSYTTGRTDFLDLLDAERMLFSLQTGYEDTFARYMKAVSALERTLGVSSLSEIESF